MSYKFEMRIEIDTGTKWEYTAWQWDGLTGNITPMLNKAFGGDDWDNQINGKLGDEILPIVAKAYLVLTDDELHGQFVALNPSNGWGDYEGVKLFMRSLLEACITHGKATLGVSW